MEITKIDNPPNVPYPVKKVSAGIACAQNVRAEVRSGHRHKHLTISKYELLIAIMSFSGVFILVCRSLLSNFYGRQCQNFPRHQNGARKYEILKIRNPGILKSKNIEIQQSQNSEILKSLTPEIQESRNPGISKSPNLKIPKS